MSWLDRFRQGSFRGVPFRVADDDTSGGRRTVEHEYVLKDIPFAEDLGRQRKEFSISGYVLGPDYDLARNALEDALDTAGPGQLVHPYRGTLTVVSTGYNTRHTKDEGGICYFTMRFIEAGEQQFPLATVDRAFTVDAAAGGLVTALAQNATLRLVLDSVPEFVRAAASGEVSRLARVLLRLTFPGAGTDALADYQRTAGLLDLDAAALGGDAAALVSRVAAAIAAIRTLGDGAQAVTNLNTVRAFAEEGEPLTTPSRIAADNNRQAVGDLIRGAAAAEQARALLAVRFGSYEEALAAREDMAGFLDGLADDAADEVYVSLQALRAEVVAAVPGEDENLPRLAHITLAEPVPALVLAYDVYEDTGRGAEIVARNHIRHPGFVPGGRALEVLTRE